MQEPSSSVALAEVVCEVELRGVKPTLGCASAEGDEGELPGGVSAVILGGQGENVTLASANEALASGTFSADVTVQNLIGQPLATTDGATADAEGVRVFFDQEPVATDGTGTVGVANADGTATFTASGQPFFRYDGALLGADGLLSTDETSGAKTWQFTVDSGVESFRFFLLVDGAVEFPDGWVEVSPASFEVAEGETEQLEGTALDVTGDPSGASIGWSSSEEGVATVDGTGLVTGQGGGSATITASSDGPEADGTSAADVLGFDETTVEYIMPPASVDVHDTESNTHVRLFQEQEKTLSTDVDVDANSPGTYDQTSDLGTFTISSGTDVTSYLLHLDPVSTNLVVLSGSVTFPRTILGLAMSSTKVRASDGELGASGTTYPSSGGGLELDGPHDVIVWSGNTVSFTLGADVGIDQMRVITEAP